MSAEHTPTVSIVLRADHRWALVAEAVRSVRAQTFQDWELLVVDDGSQELPSAALASPPDRRVRLLRGDVARAAAKGSPGLGEATGTWVASIASDAVWARTKLEQELRALAEGRESSLAKREPPAPAQPEEAAPPTTAPLPEAPAPTTSAAPREEGRPTRNAAPPEAARPTTPAVPPKQARPTTRAATPEKATSPRSAAPPVRDVTVEPPVREESPAPPTSSWPAWLKPRWWATLARSLLGRSGPK